MPDRGFVAAVRDHDRQGPLARRGVLALGGRETRDAVLQVYMFLRKIGSQISLYSLGGPKTIAQAAGYAAYDGVPSC